MGIGNGTEATVSRGRGRREVIIGGIKVVSIGAAEAKEIGREPRMK